MAALKAMRQYVQACLDDPKPGLEYTRATVGQDRIAQADAAIDKAGGKEEADGLPVHPDRSADSGVASLPAVQDLAQRELAAVCKELTENATDILRQIGEIGQIMKDAERFLGVKP